MGRRTISNLSRDLKVSRPRIYRALDRLGIEKKSGAEYSVKEWELLIKELTVTAESNQEKREDAEKIDNAGKERSRSSGGSTGSSSLETIEKSTLKERLKNAKQEYDYNRDLITVFQEETKIYAGENGKTTMRTNNGTAAAIPSIVNLEKYIKLNIALSKLIGEIENELDFASEDEGDDPFG